MLESAAVPDRVVVSHNSSNGLGLWTERTELLYDNEGDPCWLEHPVHGRNVDAVALPVTVDSEVSVYPYDPAAPGSDILTTPGNFASVVGFPFGITGGRRLAIWTLASIATEMELDFNDLPCFLVDSRTRTGQSGSPVIMHRVGAYLRADGGFSAIIGEVERFLGVYSGRINQDSDLGQVWKSEAILEVISGEKRGVHPVGGSTGS